MKRGKVRKFLDKLDDQGIDDLIAELVSRNWIKTPRRIIAEYKNQQDILENKARAARLRDAAEEASRLQRMAEARERMTA